jgi:hypothetical protein
MYGISHQSIIPVRLQPSDKSEMVTQILFGESYNILDDLDGWLLICTHFDRYEGWIDRKMSTPADESFFLRLKEYPVMIVDDVAARADNVSDKLPAFLVKGSVLPLFKEGCFSMGGSTYTFNGSVTEIPDYPDLSKLEKNALSYINVPYLWGGRTPFGIDCSGFVQIVFRNCGIRLPRDASQQAGLGESISFIYEALPGDLAFFDNSTGAITHVGILLGEGQIIHSSGSVRIDTIDHNGIFNKETGKYTHTLRIIKRVTGKV